jgi:hypothetical protein
MRAADVMAKLRQKKGKKMHWIFAHFANGIFFVRRKDIDL